MLSWLMVGLQAGLALVGLVGLWRYVLPATDRLRQPGLVLDVWGPLAIALPLIFCVGRVDGPITGPGWIAVAGPILASVIAGGLALSLARPGPATGGSATMLRCGLACAGTGVLLLLLGGAHDLSTSVGQAAFAAAAVLLWINTPIDHGSASPAAAPVHRRAGAAMITVLACALGQGLATLGVEADAMVASQMVALVYAATGVLGAAATGGCGSWRRLAGWSATIGVLVSLGAVSLVQLLPRIRVLIATGRLEAGDDLRRLAYGFGHLAPEAVLLILLGAAVALGDDRRIPARRWIGAAAVIAAAWLVMHRLAGAGAIGA